jgi:hypothetical protein
MMDSAVGEGRQMLSGAVRCILVLRFRLLLVVNVGSGADALIGEDVWVLSCSGISSITSGSCCRRLRLCTCSDGAWSAGRQLVERKYGAVNVRKKQKVPLGSVGEA